MIDTRTAEYGAFILRLTLGVLFIAHALLKLVVFGLPGTAGFFQSVGLPGWLAYVVTFAELLGGAALMVGFHARQVALALIPILLGAIVTVHAANGWLFDNKGGGWEFPAFWAVALLVQFLLGDGAFALTKSKT
ncbi:MAG: DoxX family protein [Burkholderiales bacterium]